MKMRRTQNSVLRLTILMCMALAGLASYPAAGATCPDGKERSVTQAQAIRIAALEKQSAELAQLKLEVSMMLDVIERSDNTPIIAVSR
jgi:hypothetical protein